jgi:hypothetical protein
MTVSVFSTSRLLATRESANRFVVDILERTASPEVTYAALLTSLQFEAPATKVRDPLGLRISSFRLPP